MCTCVECLYLQLLLFSVFSFLFHLNKSTICFFCFSFISSPARQVSAALLPAPQLCWTHPGDCGGGIGLFSMKSPLMNIIVMQLETQAPVAFQKYIWQLQSQRVSRSNRGWVSLLRRCQQFPFLILFFVGISTQLAKRRNLEAGNNENNLISSWS